MSNQTKRIIGFLMAALLALQVVPVPAWGGEPENGVNYGMLTAFAQYENAITVPFGTAEADIGLPENMTATVEFFTPTETPTDIETASGSALTPMGAEQAQIPVTWQAQPEYNGETPGEYAFTAVINAGGYALLAAPPVITVTVLEAEKAPSSAVTITIAEGEYSNALYLEAGKPVTDADLLAGVSAQDGYGEPVTVTVADMDGLDLDNPQSRFVDDPVLGKVNNPYTITYAAGEDENRATATRECYVTPARDNITLTNLNADLLIGTWNGSGTNPGDGHRYVEFGGITWRVLEVTDSDADNHGKKTAFLLAENSVGSNQIFDNRFNDGISSNDWNISTIKAWLNNDFYNNTFLNDERNAIVSCTAADANVFLLSVDEAYNSRYFANDADRDISLNWWLRSPGLAGDRAAYVISGGIVVGDGSYMFNTFDVRPALKIDLSSSFFTTSNAAYGPEVTVKDKSGAAVADARVSFSSGAAVPEEKNSNSEGYVSFGPRQSGSYTLTVSKDGYVTDSETIELNAGSMKFTVTLLREPAEYSITFHLTTVHDTVKEEYVWPVEGDSWDEYPSYTSGEVFMLPEAFTNYYTFEGWYDNEELQGEPVTQIGADDYGIKEFWAKWTPETHTITYHLEGGTMPQGEWGSYPYGEIFTLPVPTREGYDFWGWMPTPNWTYGPSVEISADSVDELVFYARWTAKTYEITYDLNDGTLDPDSPTRYTYGTVTTLPTAPTKYGYTFDSWHDNEALSGDPVTEISATDTGDKKFYAKWKANTYPITYHLNGGALPGGEWKSYTYGVVLTFPTPAKEGYTFGGWYKNADFSVLTTATGSTEIGDIELWAKWTALDLSIIYMSDAYPPSGGEGWTYDTATQVYTITDGANVTVTGSNQQPSASQRRLVVAEDAEAAVTLNGVTIEGLADNQSPLLLGAELTLTLTGESTLTAGRFSAGIQTTDAALIIEGSGVLT
ncbi:MAG: InlB B-repeat-containing protein, partial [Clostridiales bacterium]|nr:InlB B-repeat-containing protein [Clostridiales bacterium]